MLKRFFLGAVFVWFLALAAGPARAQDQMHKTVYTYVSEWAVPRAMWPEMASQQAADHALLDKFLADGTITGYGDFVNLVHQEGQPTHGGWFQSNSISGILRVIAAFVAQPGVTAPVLAASRHWDLFLESDADQIAERPGTFTDTYLRVISVRLKPGQGANFDKIFKTYLAPVYKNLLANGTLLYYGINDEYVVTSVPDEIDVAYIAANADAVDKVNDAFDAAFAKNPAVITALVAATKPGSFRSFLYSVPYMKAK